MAWTDTQKAEVIAEYLEANPTPATSTEIIKAIAEARDESPNGVRMILVQSGNYVKKDAVATTSDKKAAAGSEGKAVRVSKESSIAALKEAIEAKGLPVDHDLLDKLTGKAAVYLATLFA